MSADADGFDVAVIGGGPGGYVAALRAAQLGHRVALIERERLGGVCLNWGCIPTKALLRSAELVDELREAAQLGVRVQNVEVDCAALVQRSRGIADRLRAGVGHLLARQHVQVLDGHARLCGNGAVAVTSAQGVRRLQASHIIVATGARAREVPPIVPDGNRIWGVHEALTPKAVPRSVLVFGAGAIGLEFASFYASLGAEVSLVEAAAHLAPQEDEEIAALLRRHLERRGIRVLTGHRARAVQYAAQGIQVALDGPAGAPVLEAEAAIAAMGVVGNVEDLGLAGTQVRVEQGHIAVDEWCRTDEPGVYAIGDVAAAPWLAHKASHEGVLVAEHLSGLPGLHPLDRARIPGCIYATPQVASVGLNEQRARALGRNVKIGRYPFAANGKALAQGTEQGLVKLLFDADSGELLGAHLIGSGVTELIHGFVIGMQAEATLQELQNSVLPHPTLSEMLHEAALAADGRALHV